MSDGHDFRIDVTNDADDVFDLYSLPLDNAQTFAISGFVGFDEGAIEARIFPNAPLTRVRFTYSTKVRRPTRRHRRLCERDGHPAARLAPEYVSRAKPSPSEPGTWSVDLEVDHVDYWCQRCGASLAEA